MLECTPELRSGRTLDSAASQAPRDANIEPVELGRTSDDFARGSATEGFYSGAQGRVLQALEVLAHGLRIHTAVSGNIAVVEKFSVAEGQRVEEPGECRGVSGQSFVKDLLFQVVVHVARESATVPRRVVVLRNQPAVERSEQIETRNFRSSKRVESEAPGSAP